MAIDETPAKHIADAPPTMGAFLDMVLDRSEISSERNLTIVLGRAHNSITKWRAGRTYPQDRDMVRMAQLIDFPPETALTYLHYWRASAVGKPHYLQILKRLTASAALLFLIIPQVITPFSFDFMGCDRSALFPHNIHYATFRRLALIIKNFLTYHKFTLFSFC